MNNKKKMILLSDDMRMSSGIATISKNLVMGTVDSYDWFQVGAAVNHPDKGKMLDLSADVQKRTGVDDASVKILPWAGYGNPDLLRQIINSEQPDGIVFFTDPRYFKWLFEIEHEIRQNCPLIYYNIWDSTPDPNYNANFYASCDGLLSISKQTYGINHRVVENKFGKDFKDKICIQYVPHGIDSEEFKPVDVPNEFRKSILGDGDYDFVFFWSNRNIRRKQPADVIMAYKEFCDRLSKEEADTTVLLMHTQPVDQNGTDLTEVVKNLAPNYNIIFSDKKLPTDKLNLLYNLSDCTINIAGNEGFGLTTAESVMAGTPIIVNVTGGLQDQCGFKLDEKYLTADDYMEIGSLHNWRKWEHNVTSGPWCNPVWSRAQTLAGSVPTPYIWDDKVDIFNVATSMYEIYHTSKGKLKEFGLEGRRAFIEDVGLSKENMCQQLTNGINSTLENFQPRKRYELFKIS